MAKKIIKFKIDSQSLLKRANARYEKNDYSAALGFLHQAQKIKPKDTDIGLERAFVYGDMGLYEMQLKTLIGLMSMGRDDAEVYKEIIKCYTEMAMIDQALYFYNEALERGVFDDSYLDEFIDYEYEVEGADIKMRDSRDKVNVLKLSHKLLSSGDIEFARQLMETIQPDCYQYLDATNLLAIIALTNENHQSAIDYSLRALSIDEDNIYAISHLIMSYEVMGDEINKKLYIDKLLELDITKPNELSVAAFCMQKIKNSELARMYLEKLLNVMPYSRDHLISSALANHNCGNKHRARQLLIRANNIYPDDVTINYYLVLISREDVGRDLEITSSLPIEIIESWNKELEEFEQSFDLETIKINGISDQLNEKILWAFQFVDWRLQSRLAKLLVVFKEWEQYLRKLLIDPGFDFRAKKECLQAILFVSNNKNFDLFVGDMYLNFHPKIPRGSYPLEMMLSYWHVYTTLAFIGMDFDDKLNKCFKNMVNCYNENGLKKLKLKTSVLSALLLYRVNTKHVLKNKSDCCEIFNCDLTDFEVYDDIFPQAKTARKKQPQKSSQSIDNDAMSGDKNL